MIYYINLLIFNFIENDNLTYNININNNIFSIKGNYSLLTLTNILNKLPKNYKILNIESLVNKKDKFILISIKTKINPFNIKEFLNVKKQLNSIAKKLSFKIKIIPEELIKEIYFI